MLAANGVECRHRARRITTDDLRGFDYVLTMDSANLRPVRAMVQGKAKIAPLLGFAPQSGLRDVPDPYYTGDFEGVYDLVEQAATGLLTAIREEHQM